MKASIRKTTRLLFIYLISILIAIATLFPIYWLFVVSARTKVEVFAGPKLIQTTFYAENYTRPFLHDIFGRYLLNSLIIGFRDQATFSFGRSPTAWHHRQYSSFLFFSFSPVWVSGIPGLA